MDKKFLYWNTRGSCGSGLFKNLRLILNGFSPSIIILSDTKCTEESRFSSLLRLGYDNISCVPSEGRSGGLVVIWDSSQVLVSILHKDRQFIHALCVVPGIPNFLLSSVYALPHSDFRTILWSKLKQLADTIFMPWIVWGDFNDILLDNERVGGAGGNRSRMRWFRDKSQECGLIDMGASGPKFTWKGRA